MKKTQENSFNQNITVHVSHYARLFDLLFSERGSMYSCAMPLL